MSPGKKILIVDDEPGIVLGLSDQLEMEGYKVITTTDGEKGLALVRKQHPDLIVLDIMLPKINGFEVCKQLRMEGNQTPVLMLTAKGDEIDKVLGLELGADDYVTKPFSLREVVARIHAILRRVEEQGRKNPLECLEFGNVILDFLKFEAWKGKQRLNLTPRQFRIMQLLGEHPGEVLTRDQFLDEIWGGEVYVTNRSVDTQISNLRKKLEKDPEHPLHIISIRSVGYKFVPEVEK